MTTTMYGNQCESDNAFTRKARLLQSMYRVELDEEEGVGPTRTSKQKYGNMISDGEVSGKNFLMKETFEYAKERIRNKKSTRLLMSSDYSTICFQACRWHSTCSTPSCYF